MTRSAERETFHADIVCTAAEGGISGWGYAKNQRWYYNSGLPDDDGGLSPQRHGGDNYTFTLVEIGDGDLEKEHKITPATVAKGYGVLMRAQKQGGEALEKLGLDAGYRKTMIAAYHEKDAGDIDAVLADWLIQLALFGEVVYSVKPVPRSPQERLEFEQDWDRRVEEAWVKNGKPPSSNHRGGYPGPSIINSRKERR